MNSSASIQRLPIYTAVMATIVVMLSLMDPINLPKLWILCLGAGLSFAIFSSQILQLWNSPKRILLVVSVIFVGALLVTSVASQQGVFRTLVGVWGRNNGSLAYLALIIIFLSLGSMKSDESSKFLVNSLMLLGVFASLYGLMQNAGADLISWNNVGGKIILTLGNANFASAFLALSAIATLTVLLQPSIQFWKAGILFVSFLLQIYLTKQSDSLQGLLVLLLGSAILIGLFFTFSQREKIKKFALLWWGSLITMSSIGVTGLAGFGPLASFLNPNLRSLQDRYYHWIAALNMMKDHLIFGVGIDSFGDFYRRSRIIEAIELRGTAATGTNNAHNTIMQIGATGGLVLLLAYLTLIVFTGYRSVVALKKFDNKILVSGIFSIWIAFQVQSLVSIDQIGLVVWGWAAAGCLVAMSYIEPSPRNSKRVVKNTPSTSELKMFPNKVVGSILIFVGLIPAAALIPTMQNEIAIRNQVVQLISSTSEEAKSLNANNLSTEVLKSGHPELRLIALQYFAQMNVSDIALDLALANANQFPNSFESWDTLARIYEGLGQKQEAVFARKVTVKLDPLNADIQILLEADMAPN
jgi:O-antigen ligase